MDGVGARGRGPWLGSDTKRLVRLPGILKLLICPEMASLCFLAVILRNGHLWNADCVILGLLWM